MGKKSVENKKYLYGVLILAAVPWLASFLYGLLVRANLFELYLPASNWNDELLYYSMTQNIAEYGMTRGYMGFNEMHSELFSFAAWSPVILLQWVVWGFLFGWNMMSPYISNLFFMSLCLCVYVLFAKPKFKQALIMACSMIAFIPLARFILSCVPEVELWGLSILFWGLCVKVCRKLYSAEKVTKGIFIGMYVLILLLTWMRPYLLTFAVVPLVLGIVAAKKENKNLLFPIAAFIISCVLTVGGYLAITKYFCSPYTEDLFYADWVNVFLNSGFAEGIRFASGKFVASLKEVYGLILACFRRNAYYASGLYYLIFLVLCAGMGILFLIRFVRNVLKEEGKGLWLFLEFSLLLSMVAFFVADMLMYRIQEGGRHTLVYLMVSFVLVPVCYSETFDKGKNIPAILAGLFVLAVFAGWGNIPYEFSLPVKEPLLLESMEKLESELDGKMILSKEGPSYENTVIWTDDSPFGYYYALKPGYGINFCTTAFLFENMDNLHSRYIGVKKGSDKEEWCKERGYEPLAGNDEIVFYSRY